MFVIDVGSPRVANWSYFACQQLTYYLIIVSACYKILVLYN